MRSHRQWCRRLVLGQVSGATATPAAARTRVSMAANHRVCVPPIETPVTATRRGSTSGRAHRSVSSAWWSAMIRPRRLCPVVRRVAVASEPWYSFQREFSPRSFWPNGCTSITR